MANEVEAGVFYMVWNPNGHTPTYQHETGVAAAAEAERLASLNPGLRFYVLKATEYRESTGMRRVQLDPSKRRLPGAPF